MKNHVISTYPRIMNQALYDDLIAGQTHIVYSSAALAVQTGRIIEEKLGDSGNAMLDAMTANIEAVQ